MLEYKCLSIVHSHYVIMSLDNLIPDRYTRIARVAPFLIVALPLGIATFVWFPEEVKEWKSALGSSALWIVCAFLISQFVRDAGSKKQTLLFKKWGGAPTTRILRHRNSTNSVILGLRHRKLEQLLSVGFSDFKMPSEIEEKEDPSFADEKYEACINFLRNQTRDVERFKLIFNENCNYGFRRNLWGMKTLGLPVAVISAFTVALKVWHKYDGKLEYLSLEIALFFIIDIIVLMWVLLINMEWVESVAYKYAHALLDSCDKIQVNNSTS